MSVSDQKQTRENEERHSRCHVEVWLMACHLRTELLEPILTLLKDTTLQNTKCVISLIFTNAGGCWDIHLRSLLIQKKSMTLAIIV